MKSLAAIAAVGAIALAGCTNPFANATPAQIAATLCAGASAGIAIVQSDGTILKQSGGMASAESQAASLAVADCAAVQAALPGLTGATAEVASYKLRHEGKLWLSPKALASLGLK